MSARVDISDLKPGMVILEVTRQNGPVKIKKSGLVSSESMIQGLAEMGVQEVAIDPDQTVEIDAPVVATSKTQRLLEQDAGREQGLDHALSEQFNRSLFLPSVNELPSAWQIYLRQAVVSVLLLSGGFATGWSIAHVDQWYLALNPPVAETQHSTVAQTSDNVSEVAAPAMQNDAPVETVQTEQLETAQLPVEAEPEPTQQDLVLGYVPLQGEDISEQDRTDEQLNPELVKRFEQAIASLDGDPQPTVNTTSTVSEPSVPKVHELPAWILTELPSMAFSAHMYASDPSERWIRVNGERMVEGQYIENDLRLVRIDPQHVILAYKGQEFSLAALTDW